MLLNLLQSFSTVVFNVFGRKRNQEETSEILNLNVRYNYLQCSIYDATLNIKSLGWSCGT